MIRIEAVWLAVEPVDLRAGMDTVLARVVAVFGAAQPHQAYLFTNRRALTIVLVALGALLLRGYPRAGRALVIVGTAALWLLSLPVVA